MNLWTKLIHLCLIHLCLPVLFLPPWLPAPPWLLSPGPSFCMSLSVSRSLHQFVANITTGSSSWPLWCGFLLCWPCLIFGFLPFGFFVFYFNRKPSFDPYVPRTSEFWLLPNLPGSRICILPQNPKVSASNCQLPTLSIILWRGSLSMVLKTWNILLWGCKPFVCCPSCLIICLFTYFTY